MPGFLSCYNNVKLLTGSYKIFATIEIFQLSLSLYESKESAWLHNIILFLTFTRLINPSEFASQVVPTISPGDLAFLLNLSFRWFGIRSCLGKMSRLSPNWRHLVWRLIWVHFSVLRQHFHRTDDCWLLLRPFWQSRDVFSRLILTAKVFLLQRTSKQFGPLRLDLFRGIYLFSRNAFQFGFAPSKPCFSFEFLLMLHRGKPAMNWFFSRRSMWPIEKYFN